MKKIFLIIILTINLCDAFGQEKDQPKPIDHGGSGTVNAKAVNLIKPPLAICDCKFDSPLQLVKVELEISESGNVVNAKAISGHPFLRQLAEQAARASKFSVTIIGGKPHKGFTELIYTFNYAEQTVSITDSVVRFWKLDSLGVINGLANDLPKPEYSDEAMNFCANGKVEVEVLIDENGNVIEAKAVSGDELLWNASVEAAKKAKFQRYFDYEPTKIKGIIVYNFDSLSKCISVEVVNKKAVSIPKPIIINLRNPKQEETVSIQIVIDESGKVISARAISGHPLFRGACEYSARQAKFPPTLIDPGPLKVKAILVYKFKPDGTIEF